MNQKRGIPGRPPRTPPGGAGGPAGNAGARGALLLAVAVILGIVLLQQFDTPDIPSGTVSATSIPDPDETSTTRRVGLTTVPPVTTTVARARPKAEVKVLVANGAGVRGLGGSTTNALKEKGYTNAAAPTDATTAVPRTAIQFVEGYEAEARELAGVLSLPATVVTRLASPPVAAADIGDAKVLVILGEDVATATSTSAPAPGAGATTTIRRP